MKKYKLLKDLPLAKPGTIFENVDDFEMCQIRDSKGDGKGYDLSMEFFGDKFDEWFEEVEKMEEDDD